MMPAMKHASYVHAWQRARQHTDALFAHVLPSAAFDRPIGARHRVAFYMGHLEAFDRNLLARLVPLSSPSPEWDRRFAFGIDPTTEANLPTDAVSDWPTLMEIQAYAQQTRTQLDAAVQQADLDTHTDDGALTLHTALHVMLEHRWMHAETLLYMLRQLPLDALRAPTIMDARPSDHASNTDWHAMAAVPAGAATLGQRRTRDGFGWDNEFQAHSAWVDAFRIDAFPVTHARYLEFMEAGGYQTEEWWRPEDWAWVQSQGRTQPQHWRRDGSGWRLRRLFDEVVLPMHTPVYCTYAEAHAYARFVGKRLPSEAQWQRAAYGTAAGHERLFPWGDEPPMPAHGNFNHQGRAACRADAHPAGASAFGVHDLLGNGWEWTRTPFAPLPGFTPFSFYPGYSTDFFDDQHFVLKGGSAATALPLLRRSFRNWFQPHYPYVDATFRCVED